MAKKNKHAKTREPSGYEPSFESEESVEQPRTKYKTVLAYMLDQDEVNRLIEASTSEYVEPPRPAFDTDYLTYTKEECSALLDGEFHPRKVKKTRK